MGDIAEFRLQLISGAEVDAALDYRQIVFVEKACEILVRNDVLEEAELCQWQGTGGPRSRKAAVSAAAINPADSSVSLVLAHFDGSIDETPVVSATEVGRLLKMGTAFLDLALSGALDGIGEKDSPVSELIDQIRARRDSLVKARLLLVTDVRVSDKVRELAPETIGNVVCERHVWDVARLHELDGSGHEKIEIALVDEFGVGIACLPAHVGATEYAAYLCVVPGSLIADLYGRYGARLLETNVRGFLSDRGKVNRGLRATIENRPAMFFAYNNGLTATASHVQVETVGGEKQIVRLTDLQIVNGGQTTASLFWARKKHKASLDSVFVQMKLSVIPDEHLDQLDRIVADIAKLANSQNKVSDADLFSNHPFHRQIERISRRTGVPARDGGQYQTYWFYERARAQYANERAALTGTAARLFDQKFPKKWCIDKTDLAKFMNAWERSPHIVSAGAQKSFKAFADQITARWDRNPDQFNEVYFKRAVGVGILYWGLEGLVQKQDWYEAHRAPLIAYTISVLSNAIEMKDLRLNLLRIWEEQDLSDDVEVGLTNLARTVWFALKDHDKRKDRVQWGNLGEWFKAKECWEIARQLDTAVPTAFKRLLIDREQYDRQERGGQRSQRVDAGIDAQMEATRLHDSGYWQRLKDWNQEDPVLSEEEDEALRRALNLIPGRSLSESDSRRLMQAKQRAETNGFVI
jgi:hypothetical protein